MAPLPKEGHLNDKNKQIISKGIGDSTEHLLLIFFTERNMKSYFYIFILITQSIQTNLILHSKVGNSHLLQHDFLSCVFCQSSDIFLDESLE